MKKVDNMLKSYVSGLVDEDVRYLYARLAQRLSGDLPDAISFLSDNYEVDKWMKSAKSSDELYDMVDYVQKFVERECLARKLD